ncbi:hypothetical protein GCM10010885_05100 [Alicyclobacillus cellulosilyticus]|uniref:Uncharacterized protein n=1 Tax=Alicyclobacillus cellulosilyticus TaxID=1003997 RepID=A0A917K2J9_9BACL|nr:hypothetical protein [Alicyclobacillus cellulosilyticus]GGI98584.1 hypothetical protein GCM10010885_05100 [Alicyclobacillus cellulosilyticus]
MRRGLGIFLAACAVVTGTEWITFRYYDHLLGGAAVSAAAPARPAFSVRPVHGVLPAGGNPNLVAVTADGTQLAYVGQDAVLRVVDVATGRVTFTRALQAPADYVEWISGTNLFVGTVKDHAQTRDLELNTIDTSLQDFREVQTFSYLGKSSDFLHIAFSPFTNDIYVVIGNAVSTVVYHFDTNGALSEVPLGFPRVDAVGVAQTTGVMYFAVTTGSGPAVYAYQHGQSTLLVRGAVLLGVVGDAVYCGVLDAQGRVTEVLRFPAGAGKAQPAAKLPDPVPPAAVGVDDEGHVFVVAGTVCRDVTAHVSIPLPAYDRASIVGGALLLFRHGALIGVGA